MDASKISLVMSFSVIFYTSFMSSSRGAAEARRLVSPIILLRDSASLREIYLPAILSLTNASSATTFDLRAAVPATATIPLTNSLLFILLPFFHYCLAIKYPIATAMRLIATLPNA